MDSLVVRLAEPRDLPEVAAMCHALWPDRTADEHAQSLAPLLAGRPPGALPDVVFVAEDPDGRLTGFIDVDLRSHADGCDPSRPVGYIEGWYVAPDRRRQNVGAQLIAAAEDWARRHGALEMASDTWLHALDSQHAHAALGYEVVDRCVHFRKPLATS